MVTVVIVFILADLTKYLVIAATIIQVVAMFKAIIGLIFLAFILEILRINY